MYTNRLMDVGLHPRRNNIDFYIPTYKDRVICILHQFTNLL